MPPEASIIIRTLNEAKYLENLLKGIHGQNHRAWEIVLVDSGSTDGTVEIARKYGARVFHIPKEEFTFGGSLNRGCQEALGRYLVFVSGHVWPITNTWLANLLKPFAEPEVAMVYGRQRGTSATNPCEARDFLMQFGVTSQILVDEPKGHNGNAAIRRDLWAEQPFDESLPAQEDVDWARKIQNKHYRVFYAADAAVYHAHDESLKQVYRRHRNEAVATKRMFPHNRLTWPGIVRRLPYFIGLDILFALRGRQYRQLFRVPLLRAVQVLGLYRGLRYQSKLASDTVRLHATPETYRNVVVDEKGNHGVREARIPDLRPWEVLVRVAFAGVIPEDREGTNSYPGDSRGEGGRFSFVPGHDFVGVVEKIGSRVRGLKKGEKVVGLCGIGRRNTAVADKEPGDGESQNAESNALTGIGAYSEYIAAPSDRLRKIPADMPLKHGTLVKPVAICLGSLHQARGKPDLSACVVGAGLMGNLCVQILRGRGVHVTVVDRNAGWLSHLSKLDVDILDETPPLHKYDLVIESRGDEQMAASLAATLTPATQLLLFAPNTVYASQDRGKRPQTDDHLGDCPGDQEQKDWKEAIRLVRSGAVRLDDYATAVEVLDRYQNAWSSAESGEHLRVLLGAGKDLAEL